MKLALMGDIHGNHLALKTVLNAASASGVEKLLITGDLVGYYYAPVEVIEMLKSWDTYIVRGNHEEMLRRARTEPSYLAQVDARYGYGLRVAIEQLDSKQLDELCNLPHPLELEIDGYKILLCHGSPWDIDQYVYPDSEIEVLERCANKNFDLVVMGHTHYPMEQKFGRTRVINPGSIGQSRNRQPGAHWVIFDTVSGHLEFHKEIYDSSQIAIECQQRNPNLPYLTEVLARNE